MKIYKRVLTVFIFAAIAVLCSVLIFNQPVSFINILIIVLLNIIIVNKLDI